HLEPEGAGLGDDGEAIGRRRGKDREVDRFGVWTALGRVEAGEPQEVVEQLPHPLRLGVDPGERVAIPVGWSLLGKSEARLRLDDGEWCPQLVRRVGRELELAAPRRLDWGRNPPADRDRAQEDDREEDGRDEDFGKDDGSAGLVERLERLPDDQVAGLGLVPELIADWRARGPELLAGDGAGRRRRNGLVRVGPMAGVRGVLAD